MRAPWILLAAMTGVSCMDPVHSNAVDALGGETQGVRPGPTHRPGQPCLTCHGSSGPANPEMSVAGTAYAVRGGPDPLQGATVTLTDANNVSRTVTTNSVGNFYVFKQEWDPIFPLSVSLSDGTTSIAMQTTIGRDGACATCHKGAGDPEHMPAVYLKAQ